ncbi:unnamed protein product [Dovyalis caffra]|uniref:Uncharacterized protein n=1 Tax=Dovyalis caffra TaxID=77055 RepID=A0AAV1RV69_9ROSI|nr:unnamed protein product [Dovyalis caffra]
MGLDQAKRRKRWKRRKEKNSFENFPYPNVRMPIYDIQTHDSKKALLLNLTGEIKEGLCEPTTQAKLFYTGLDLESRSPSDNVGTDIHDLLIRDKKQNGEERREKM